jgi:hypothetical protein
MPLAIHILLTSPSFAYISETRRFWECANAYRLLLVLIANGASRRRSAPPELHAFNSTAPVMHHTAVSLLPAQHAPLGAARHTLTLQTCAAGRKCAVPSRHVRAFRSQATDEPRTTQNLSAIAKARFDSPARATTLVVQKLLPCSVVAATQRRTTDSTRTGGH